MCRILAVRAREPLVLADVLRPFAAMARASREFQGDGWGVAWWTGAAWDRYRSVRPIWDEDLTRFGKHRVCLVHARSAFRNEGIDEANNMPFLAGGDAFVFNGELRGVRIAEEGRIGAEKLFNLFRRIKPSTTDDWNRAAGVVTARTRYVRAMNFVFAKPDAFTTLSMFNEDPEYFTMHLRRDARGAMVCSEPLDGFEGWSPIPQGVAITLS
jgi:glutamine amidotransferase